MPETHDYWPTVGAAVVVYVDAAIYTDDPRTALDAVRALFVRYGPQSLLDFAAVLLLNVARNCPDQYRTPEGRADVRALTQDRPVNAERITHTAALVGGFFGRPVTDESLRATERQAEALADARPLVQAALDAAPRLPAVAVALRPAADSLHSVAAVISLATVALEKVVHPPDPPG